MRKILICHKCQISMTPNHIVYYIHAVNHSPGMHHNCNMLRKSDLIKHFYVYMALEPLEIQFYGMKGLPYLN